MKLGEALLRRRIINENQLKRALETQMICGGHLGTCLIELGYLDEDRLGKVLADLLDVRYAHRDLFLRIPPRVISSMNSPLVERNRAIPFDQKGKVLHVAMVEPKNLHSLDEIAFATSCRIESWIAPEARIFEAMERYYDVPRRVRYIRLCRQMDERIMSVIPAHEFQTAGAAAEMAVEALGPGPQEAAGVIEIPPPRTGPPPAPPKNPVSMEVGSLDQVADRMCAADGIDTLADLVTGHAARAMSRSILFSVKGDTATLWHSRGLSLDQETARETTFQVIAEPIFRLPQGDSHYRGPIPRGGKHQAFFETLRMEVPSEALIIPVHFNDRLVAIFYGDGGPGGAIRGDTEEFLRLMTKACLTLNLLALKRKIRAI